MTAFKFIFFIYVYFKNAKCLTLEIQNDCVEIMSEMKVYSKYLLDFQYPNKVFMFLIDEKRL